MTPDLSFQFACARIKEEADGDSNLITQADHLLNIAYMFAPYAAGPAAVVLLPALATKQALIGLGQKLFKRLSIVQRNDYLARMHRIENAYAILVYTAFFEAVDENMPDQLREQLQLLVAEKWHLAKAGKEEQKRSALGSEETPLAHPLDTFSEQQKDHEPLWQSMAGYYREFVMQLACWDKLKEWQQKEFHDMTAKLPDKAARQFEAQYLELCRVFPEFALWANLQEQQRRKWQLEKATGYLKEYRDFVIESGKTVDVGFQQLRTLIAGLPQQSRKAEATDIAVSLRREYEARIAEPIIADRGLSSTEGRGGALQFPTVKEAFIPQSFQVTRYAADRELENPAVWEKMPRREDLGAFLAGFLSSPHSCLTPLLILGHPGSGKSVLTKVLAAQVSSESYTVVRVVLREVTAEATILTQIEQALARATDLSQEIWRRLSPEFAGYPPLVILDGYDELLQASGKVFADYLNDVRRFQERQREQERPVRVIVTSRVTLINKARVPVGATVVRLLGFSAYQQTLWINRWNETNSHYFTATGTRPFALPIGTGANVVQLRPLAEQPLLLLMLAIYDANNNALHEGADLDQARLYDRLLRRFVQRERAKDLAYLQMTTADQTAAIDEEMRRLGTAAMGMFSRRKVHILSGELEDDLIFFRARKHRDDQPGTGMLSQADVLFGSFFFVHKSTVQSAGATANSRIPTSAFEFLHNTFGEFLTADFILREMSREVDRAIEAAAGGAALRSDYQDRMSSRDGLHPTAVGTLIYTPLCSRPVVVEMLRLWARHFLDGSDRNFEDYRRELRTLIVHQLQRILSRREMPTLLNSDEAAGNRRTVAALPLLGHMAIYSLNLVTLGALVDPEGFVFRSADYGTHEDGTPPWDRLGYLWRSWLSLENLDSFAAIVATNRVGEIVSLKAKGTFQAGHGGHRLTMIAGVAAALGDQQTSVLTRLLLLNPKTAQLDELEELTRWAQMRSLEVQRELTLLRIQILQRFAHNHVKDYVQAFVWLMNQEHIPARRIAVTTLEPVLAQVGGAGFAPHLQMEIDLTPVLVQRVCEIDVRAALLLVRATKGKVMSVWYARFVGLIAEDTMASDSWYLRNPVDWPTWLALLDELEVTGEAEAGRTSRRLLDAILSPPPNDGAFNHHHIWHAVRPLLERGDAPVRAELGRRVVLAAGQRNYFESIAQTDFDSTLPLILLGWEAGGVDFLKRLPDDVKHRWTFTNRFLRLSQSSPAAALDFFHLVSNVTPLAIAWETEGLFERTYQAAFLLSLSTVDPRISAKWLEVTLQHGGTEFLRRDDQFLRSLDPKLVQRHFTRNAGSVTTLLVLARHLKRRAIIDELVRCFEPEITHDQIANMPWFTLQHFRWLADQSSNQVLAAVRAQKTGEEPLDW